MMGITNIIIPRAGMQLTEQMQCYSTWTDSTAHISFTTDTTVTNGATVIYTHMQVLARVHTYHAHTHTHTHTHLHS